MSDVEAVCFDLDGTLCVDDQSDEDIHEQIFERVDVPAFFDPSDLYAVEYSALPDADSDREHYENVYRAVARNVGADPNHAPALARATLDVLDPTAVSFRDGAEEALEFVGERYAIGLVTAGTEATQLPKLETLGIRDRFDVTVCCGHGTGVESKPHPEPFEMALEELGVPPERALYVGNRHDGDVLGPHRTGMQSAWVPDGDAPANPEPEPTYRLSSMEELTDVL